jgi:hypothetical protein
MKHIPIFILILILILSLGLIGCGNSKTSSNPSNPSQPGQPGTDITGSWNGTVTGTNFTGSIPFSMVICLQTSGGCQTSGSPVIESINIEENCGGFAVGLPTSMPINLSGNTFTASGSSATTTISLSGTVSGNSMSGHMTFSQGPCGSPASPWSGNFSATRQ